MIASEPTCFAGGTARTSYDAAVRVIIYGAGAVGSAIGGGSAKPAPTWCSDQGPHTQPPSTRTASHCEPPRQRVGRDRGRHLDRRAPAQRRRCGDHHGEDAGHTQIHAACSTGTRRLPWCAQPTESSTSGWRCVASPNVYGMVVQLPAQFEKPGEVTVLCAPDQRHPRCRPVSGRCRRRPRRSSLR